VLHRVCRQGLEYFDSYQNFCRLLGRLKANYQLSELVRTEGYEEWLRLAAEFAVHAFQQMHVRTLALVALYGPSPCCGCLRSSTCVGVLSMLSHGLLRRVVRWRLTPCTTSWGCGLASYRQCRTCALTQRRIPC
jgi:hypothetical protein